MSCGASMMSTCRSGGVLDFLLMCRGFCEQYCNIGACIGVTCRLAGSVRSLISVSDSASDTLSSAQSAIGFSSDSVSTSSFVKRDVN